MELLNHYLELLTNTPFAIAIATGASLFPWLECIHVVAIATVVGTIAIVDLRLLGYRAHRKSAGRLIDELLPYTWAAFGIAAISGLLLFSSNAVNYADNIHFQIKMGLMLLAGINMAIFHLTAHRRVDEWDEVHPPPSSVRAAGAISLCLWTVVIFMGRWVGF
jgi:hypothetical protein